MNGTVEILVEIPNKLREGMSRVTGGWSTETQDQFLQLAIERELQRRSQQQAA